MSGKGGKARGPGPRSYEALRWLARLDVAGVEPLGLAMGFGRRATYSHLARLVDAGLVVRSYDRGGSVVAITPAGRRSIGVTRASVPVGALHGLGLQHARACLVGRCAADDSMSATGSPAAHCARIARGASTSCGA